MSVASIEHWDNAQVAYFDETVTAEQSLAAMQRRNDMYPGLLDLMPIDIPDKVILDYGCGPGHDTIGFLLHGANHVYALDTSLQGLCSTAYRLRAHGFEDRCTLIRPGPGWRWNAPRVGYVHCAGVLHHIHEPIRALNKMRHAIGRQGEIRLMVYGADSQFVRAHGGIDGFELIADGSAPIAKAWTRQEVYEMAGRPGLSAEYLGGYLMGESEGPGLGSCYSLRWL